MTGEMSFKCLVFLTVLPRVLFRTQAKVYGGVFLQNGNQILAINYFH